MKIALLLTALVLLVPLADAQKKAKAEPGSLEVGQIAPPIGELNWVQAGGVRAETNLQTLRGKVVIVADYGYYCDSCVRVGLPTLNALRASNEPGELRVIQLTAFIGDDTPELILKEAEKLKLSGPIGLTDVDGEGSPYLNMGLYGNLTYAFVIGRHGGIVWRGDPSRKRDEYVAAVSSALNSVPCEPLPAADSFGPEIAPALRDYVQGEFVKAQTDAQALLKKLGGKTGAETDKLRADVEAMLALVNGTRKKLMEELERTGGAKDAEHFQRALNNVRRVFAKGPEADRAASIEMSVATAGDQGPNCKKWAAWYALEAARPATFPADKDAAGTKYARDLSKYVKQSDVPGLERVKGWLEAFDKVQARK